MSQEFDNVLCAKTHEWVAEGENVYTVGLSEYIVEKMGDVVFVELPEVGAEFSKSEVFATIESVKSANELYMPIGGRVVEVNENLINAPELINEDVWEKGWLIKIESDSFAQDSLGLLEYEDYIEEVGA